MMTLRALDEAHVRLLYAHQLTRDFPESERKPLSGILSLCARCEYDVLAADDDGMFVAYALVYRPREGRTLLLDYLAVEPDMRGRGVGQAMLRALRQRYAETADCLMIECERPKAAPDEAEARRRIRFYQHAGAQMTNVRVWLFEVEYSILVLPCGEGEIAGRDWAGQILGLYKQMLAPEAYMRNVRLIRG